ncbi:MAG: sulfatase [Acidobacteria bacterium]|nr:sulfatase [Acidobacteriota bacterium]
MTRREFAGGVAGLGAAVPSRTRRNLIFILGDDHRFDMLGALGHPWLKTPNLDRLVKQGVLFQNAFVTTSLCSPSRASILTGQYAHAHGVLDNSSPLPANLTTYPRILQRHGYRTALVGKWHMGGDSDEPRPGFDRWASFRGQGQYVDPVINVDGRRSKVPGYVSDILTGEALRFIGENASRPFALYLGHKAVHAEFTCAERHRSLYQNEPIPIPRSMADTAENYRGKPGWVRQQRQSWHGVDGMYNNGTTFEKFYRDYCRTLMGIDDSVGRIVEDLERRKLLQDTLIIYMGDNGFQFGEHGLIDKRTMYEASIRVPMVAHCPDLFEPGRRVTGMALNQDICPTMLDAAGAPIPANVTGRSLLPLAQGKATNWRTEFLYEYFWERSYPQTPTVLGVRTDRHSFMQYHGTWDVDELYDVQQDPDQMNNLLAEVKIGNRGGPNFAQIKDPALKQLVTDLRQRMFRILEATGGRPEPNWRA